MTSGISSAPATRTEITHRPLFRSCPNKIRREQTSWAQSDDWHDKLFTLSLKHKFVGTVFVALRSEGDSIRHLHSSGHLLGSGHRFSFESSWFVCQTDCSRDLKKTKTKQNKKRSIFKQTRGKKGKFSSIETLSMFLNVRMHSY
jgi:hypothetical protein